MLGHGSVHNRPSGARRKLAAGPASAGAPAVRLWALLTFALTCLLLAGGGAYSSFAQAPPGQAPSPPPAAEAAKPDAAKPEAAQQEAKGPATYVGNDTCQMCHDEVVKNFAKNPHHVVKVDAKRGWKAEACESCHGPGSIHAESTAASDIRNPGKMQPKEADRVCLACHLNQRTQTGRIQNGHARNQVSCTACHSIHGTKGMGKALHQPASVNALCAGCHQPVWAEFQRPYTHRLPQNAMSCSDCHNPHGAQLPRMVRTVNANEPSCLKCHTNYRGPFTHEHAPVRLEGCGACHVPHGSANPKMLTRPEERQLCLECHSNLPSLALQPNALGNVPPAIHDLRNPRFRVCSTCHVKVHGSYVSRGLLR
jgi:DmsE family decaheme c-type cytochrome